MLFLLSASAEYYHKHQLNKKLNRRDKIIFKESFLLGGTENQLPLDLEILEFSIMMSFPKDNPPSPLLILGFCCDSVAAHSTT